MDIAMKNALFDAGLYDETRLPVIACENYPGPDPDKSEPEYDQFIAYIDKAHAWVTMTHEEAERILAGNVSSTRFDPVDQYEYAALHRVALLTFEPTSH